jgi:very-short-patch-repair endonuclease
VTDPDERPLAFAVRTLIREDQVTLALALIECDVEIYVDLNGEAWLTVTAPAEVIDIVHTGAARQGDGEFASILYYAFRDTVGPTQRLMPNVTVRALLRDVSRDWRQEIRATLEGIASNQGTAIGTTPVRTHGGLNYRSQTEIEIAKELEARGILFFPNCRANRQGVTREPDFLVVTKGAVGILEVDGPTHEGKAAIDHKRDMFFEDSGIRVKHFDATDAYNNPKGVVTKFLELLGGPTR